MGQIPAAQGNIIRRAKRAAVKVRPRRRQGKVAGPAYPADAVAPLKAFLSKSKPKGQPATAVALGRHHTQHFKAATFTNRDISAAGKAAGIKFTNLALALMSAAKQGKIRKIRKGTWKIAASARKAV